MTPNFNVEYSVPRIECQSCDRVRSCLDHPRAEFPPDAARKWMRKTCPTKGGGCLLVYRAGLTFGFVAKGQAAE